MREALRLVHIHRPAEHHQALVAADVGPQLGLARKIHVTYAEAALTEQRIEQAQRFTGRMLENQELAHEPAQFNDRSDDMAKAYWVNAFRAVRDQDALMAYAKIAGPAMQAAGGRFLARGMPAQVFEGGLLERLTLIEFDSVEQAKAAYDSPGYQEALRVLGDAADRDLRIIPGV